ncbi:MAG: response regulator [Nitrospirae bacterium]|nr:response regulator [Nitrospirota bacterium]
MKSPILIVDDEPNVIASLKRTFIDAPYEIFSACSGAEGLKILQQQEMKVVISDERMPQMAGSEFLSFVKDQYPATVRITLTGHASLDAAMQAVNRGEIYRFLTKPWDEMELKLALRSAIEKYDLEEENRRLLSVVKRQALDLRMLERKYPTITKIERDDAGHLILPEISEEEFSEIVSLCEKEFS